MSPFERPRVTGDQHKHVEGKYAHSRGIADKLIAPQEKDISHEQIMGQSLVKNTTFQDG